LAVPVIVEDPEPPGWSWMDVGLEDSVANVGVPFAKLPGRITSGSANPEKSTTVTQAPFWTLVLPHPVWNPTVMPLVVPVML